MSVICDQTESGALSFSRLQQALITELGLSFIAQHQIVFDGSLSNLEEIPEIARSAVLEVVARTEFVDLIALGHAVLSLYENPPGWWLSRRMALLRTPPKRSERHKGTLPEQSVRCSPTGISTRSLRRCESDGF